MIFIFLLLFVEGLKWTNVGKSYKNQYENQDYSEYNETGII